jgi:hypothetical protein
MPTYRLLYSESFAAYYEVEAPDEDTAREMVRDWDGDDSVVPVDRKGRKLSDGGYHDRVDVFHCETEEI